METVFPKDAIQDQVLAAIRRIVRSVELHSRKLVQSHRLTIPQVLLLKEIRRRGPLPLGDLARIASLSAATVTGIVDRLEGRGLVGRVRGTGDRRQVYVEITRAGEALMATMPPILQESFVQRLQGLEKGEKEQMLSSLERVAALMDAENLDASPILAPHALGASEEDVPGGAADLANGEDAGAGAPPGKGTAGPDPIPGLRILAVTSFDGFPEGIDLGTLARFLHESLRPYEDAPEDIERGIRDALGAPGRPGGFVLIAAGGGKIAGALVMQKTGMRGYVPENLLLFVAVGPGQRGKGLGRRLIERAIGMCEGDVKLHVEYDNPARRLYERIGFTNKYAEMRYTR